MKKLVLLMFSLLMIVSCNKDAVKKVTVEVVSKNISSMIITEGVIVCDDTQVLKDYIRQVSCKALKVDCSNDEVSKSLLKKQKSKYGKVLCESAMATIAPILFPTHYLPQELKDKNCKAVKLDYWLSFYSKQVCEKL